MKANRILVSILAFAFLLNLSGFALAETEIPIGEVVELTSGETCMFGDEALKVEFSFNLPEDGEQTVTIRVGEAENTYSGWYLVEKVYAAKLDGNDTYILVGDYGPSDDYWTEAFYYDSADKSLVDAGGMGNLPENLQLNADGTISTRIRAQALYTWYRPADFVVARGYLYMEDGYSATAPVLVEVPRLSYPMGAIANPTMDIPVYANTDFDAIAFTVPAGAQLLFASTDDATWVQVEYRNAENHENCRGFLQLDPENVWGNVLIDGQSYAGYDIFPGLIYAD